MSTVNSGRDMIGPPTRGSYRGHISSGRRGDESLMQEIASFRGVPDLRIPESAASGKSPLATGRVDVIEGAAMDPLAYPRLGEEVVGVA